MQQADEETRVVCFNAEYQGQLRQKEQSKSPCLLTNVSPQKRRYSEGTEFKMNKFSRIETPKNIPFPWKEASDLQVTTVKEVLENKINGNIVTLMARVVTKSNVQMVFSRNMQKDLRKCHVVIAVIIYLLSNWVVTMFSSINTNRHQQVFIHENIVTTH